VSVELWLAAVVFLAAANYVLAVRISAPVNPFSLMSVLFFIPALSAQLHMSGLQSGEWQRDTVTLLWLSALAWGALPYAFLWLWGKPSGVGVLRPRRISEVSLPVQRVIVALGLGFVPMYFVDTYLLSGTPLPILARGALSQVVHTQSSFGLSNFTHAGPALAVLLYMVSLVRRDRRLFLLALAVLAMPLTRGSRLNVMIGFIGVGIASFTFGTPRTLRVGSASLRLLFVTVPMLILFSVIGQVRSSFGGDLEYSLARNQRIFFSSGAYDWLAYPYVYFSMPFENLDRLVRRNGAQRLGGKFSLMPLTGTLIPTSQALDDPTSLETIVEYDDPVSPMGVSTSLAYFYMDFGPIGAVFPMVVYMLLWLILYRYRYQYHVVLGCAYATYGAVFSLAAFQAFMLHPATYRKLLILVAPFVLVSMLRAGTRGNSVEASGRGGAVGMCGDIEGRDFGEAKQSLR
jgi:oligosaccharide repeat unit polymerase